MSQNTNLDENGKYIPGGFDKMVEVIQKHLNEQILTLQPIVAKHRAFKSKVTDEEIWDAYLSGFSEENRQHHNCNCCKAFITNFGKAVLFSEATEEIIPCFWPKDVSEIPEEYRQSVTNVYNLLASRDISGVILLDSILIGSDIHGGWSHFQFSIRDAIAQGLTQEAADSIASEAVKNLVDNLKRYSMENLKKAQSLIASGKLYQKETMEDWIFYIVKLKEQFGGKSSNNFLWNAAVRWPVGWINFNNSLMGYLLNLMVADSSDEAAIKAFNYQADSARYRVQQEKELSDNQIEIANKKIAELGLEDSFHFRFAKFEELPKFWLPKAKEESAEEKPKAGLFDDLKKDAKPQEGIQWPDYSAKTITYHYFLKKILPTLEALHVKIRMAGYYTDYSTQSKEGAKPIFKWDSPEHRNPFVFTARCYFVGRDPQPLSSHDFGLVPGSIMAIKGLVQKPVTFAPENVDERLIDESEKIPVMILDYVQTDIKPDGFLIPVFLRHLRPELKEIEKVLTNYSLHHFVEGTENDTLGLTLGGNEFLATYKNDLGETVQSLFLIDRFE